MFKRTNVVLVPTKALYLHSIPSYAGSCCLLLEDFKLAFLIVSHAFLLPLLLDINASVALPLLLVGVRMCVSARVCVHCSFFLSGWCTVA